MDYSLKKMLISPWIFFLTFLLPYNKLWEKIWYIYTYMLLFFFYKEVLLLKCCNQWNLLFCLPFFFLDWNPKVNLVMKVLLKQQNVILDTQQRKWTIIGSWKFDCLGTPVQVWIDALWLTVNKCWSPLHVFSQKISHNDLNWL